MATRRGRRWAAALTAALLLAFLPFLSWPDTAEGGLPDDGRPETLVVVGDSITARYNDRPGDPEQGWWSLVAHHYGADVRTFSQSGSGYLRPGLACTGDRFADRIQAFLGGAPSVLLIEGGRNDWARCVDGVFRRASNDQIRAAVAHYMDVVARVLPSTTRVLVLAPWGPDQKLESLRVTAIIRAEAAAHGFEFVDTTGALNPDEVLDGVHPNRAGSEAIAERVIAAIG